MNQHRHILSRLAPALALALAACQGSAPANVSVGDGAAKAISALEESGEWSVFACAIVISDQTDVGKHEAIPAGAKAYEALMEDPDTIFRVKALNDGEIRAFDVSGSGQIMSNVVIPRFPGWEVAGEWTETDSGLKYYDIVIGEGPTPPASTSTVSVHYTGYLTDGSKFDSSVDRGQPSEFPLNRVISGWTEGVGSMSVGSKRKLIIPYAQAYGAQGRPPSIPPKATLIFDVELIEIVR